MKNELINKIVISGNILEYITLIRKKKDQQTLPRERKFEKAKKSDSEKREDNIRRAKTNLKRLIRSNSDLTKFITLTFKENLTDVKEANYIFQNFIKKMRKRFPDFKYIAVLEFQKRGAVHYHLICNIKGFTLNKYIADIWGQGYINIKKIKKVGVDNYLSKYLTKNKDNRLFGHRYYLYSRNCLKPLISRNLNIFLSINIHYHLKLLYKGEHSLGGFAELGYAMYELPKRLSMDNIRKIMIE